MYNSVHLISPGVLVMRIRLMAVSSELKQHSFDAFLLPGLWCISSIQCSPIVVYIQCSPVVVYIQCLLVVVYIQCSPVVV